MLVSIVSHSEWLGKVTDRPTHATKNLRPAPVPKLSQLQSQSCHSSSPKAGTALVPKLSQLRSPSCHSSGPQAVTALVPKL